MAQKISDAIACRIGGHSLSQKKCKNLAHASWVTAMISDDAGATVGHPPPSATPAHPPLREKLKEGVECPSDDLLPSPCTLLLGFAKCLEQMKLVSPGDGWKKTT